MILLFPNRTAALIYADSHHPDTLPGEGVRAVTPEVWGSSYALRVTFEKDTPKGPVLKVRYYRSEV